jgi:hypothetical protein
MLRVLQLQYADIFITLNKKILQKIYFWLIKNKLRKKIKEKLKPPYLWANKRIRRPKQNNTWPKRRKKNKTL